MSEAIKALIVDDMPLMRNQLRAMLADFFPEITICGEAGNVPDAVKLILTEQPQIIFLDVEMPGYSGLELVKFIPPNQIQGHIVFITAHADYALNAFELSAIDYLLKPVKIPELIRAVNRVKEQLTLKQHQNYIALKDNLEEANPLEKKLVLRQADAIRFVALKEVAHIKADGPYCHFHLTNGIKETIAKPMGEYERLQHTGYFFRTHRSHLVNITFIDRISKADGGFVVLKDGTEVPLVADKRQHLLDAMERFIA